LASNLNPAFVAPGSVPHAKPIWCVHADDWRSLRERLPAAARAFADDAGFEPEVGRLLLLPGKEGAVGGALLAFDAADKPAADRLLAGKLATALPAGVWRFAALPPEPRLAALAFALGGYCFDRYRARKVAAKRPRLELPAGVDGTELTRTIASVFLVRDLVNMPANERGPAELEAAARKVAAAYGAKAKVFAGAALAEKFPLVHAVGQGSARLPRVVDFTWGAPKHPKVTLVGKGVCFDTGGLDIKPDSAMLLMKKDVGGAAQALGLASMIMGAKLRVRLRVVIPAVENSVSGSAYRPGDVFRSRKGISVEIGNTDAEGRLVLADALTLADEDAPDLLIDFATLTGAARVALGPDLPAAFTEDEKLAAELMRHAATEADPVWRLPLWRPYAGMLDSKIADVNNISGSSFAGAITAALFLARFVERAKAWLHFDLFAWNPKEKPGRPEGGEAQTIRALYALLAARYR
jgi:leucyl aminopeptidase